MLVCSVDVCETLVDWVVLRSHPVNLNQSSLRTKHEVESCLSYMLHSIEIGTHGILPKQRKAEAFIGAKRYDV